MNWSSFAEFAEMGGHALYVWGSYLMAGAALCWEALMLVERRGRAIEGVREQAHPAPAAAHPANTLQG
jgi:heme exporter protein CcmD